MKLSVATVLLASTTALSACSSAPGPTVAASADGVYAEALADAVANGASDAQVAELEQAVIDGSVSLEAARASVHRTVECLVDRGMNAEYTEGLSNGTTVVPSLSIHSDQDPTAVDAAFQECENLESAWTNYLYQTQASTIEAEQAYFEQQRPVLVACLEGEGIAIDPEGDIYDLLWAAVDTAHAAGDTGGTNCLAEAEIDGF